MSALILPLIWATAANPSEPPSPFAPGARKSPQRLVLIAAAFEDAQPPHTKQLQPAAASPSRPAAPSLPEPRLAFYRRHTETLLERYMAVSFHAGRVPSLLGREIIRGNASHCLVTGFDDIIHFLHDVDSCLKRLSPGQQYLLRRIGMHGYTHAEIAASLGLSLRTTIRRYNQSLDRLTCLLVERKLLTPVLNP